MFVEPIYIPRALNTGTCIQQGDQVYSAKPTQEPVLAAANTRKKKKKLERGFGKKNAGEWTGRVEISKEEIRGSKRSIHGNILTYYRL